MTRKRRKSQQQKQNRTLRTEKLEDRIVFSGLTMAPGQNYIFKATNNDDKIVVNFTSAYEGEISIKTGNSNGVGQPKPIEFSLADLNNCQSVNYEQPFLTIKGRDGNDHITILDNGFATKNRFEFQVAVDGQKGNDFIQGSNFDERLTGGRNGQGDHARDTIYGSGGDDRIEGGPGTDHLYGDGGDDFIKGDSGNDTIWGGDGDDHLKGDSGRDHILGGPGNDKLFGDSDWDYLYGNGGDDYLKGGAGQDHLYGDWVRSGWWAGQPLGASFQGVQGAEAKESGNDHLFGDQNIDFLYGSWGNDHLFGGQGSDRLKGDEGNDTIKGDSGNDTIWGGDDDDLILGDAGRDNIKGGEGDDYIKGGAGQDTISGGIGNDKINGGQDRDKIWGGDGDDELWGGNDLARDELFGQSGNDIFYRTTWKDKLLDKTSDDTAKWWYSFSSPF